MPFNYSCFLSYRHLSGAAGYPAFVEDLAEELDGQLKLFTNVGLFRDTNRLRGGDFLVPSLARALCESVCMVMVYVPTYFAPDATYCSREFRAMELLEAKRLKRLGTNTQTHGLIIPIICAGNRFFPQEIKARRIVHNFERYFLATNRIRKHPKGRTQLNEIAGYIYDRFAEFEALGEEECRDCSTFALPSENDVLPWVQTVRTPKPPFPGSAS
jgi:hypothetical protein